MLYLAETWPHNGNAGFNTVNPRPENVGLTPCVVLKSAFFFAEPQIESGRDSELLISCLYRLGNADLNSSGCGSQHWEKLFQVTDGQTYSPGFICAIFLS